MADDGYLQPENDRYVDQKRVFEELGVSLLATAWEGYNCTLFTYGQTGSGKTYTVMGNGANKGLVPMFCEKLFTEISEKERPSGVVYQVSCSMMEIYNEKVRDLLNKGEQPKNGLPVRMSPKSGFFVEGLMTCPVSDYRSIQYQIDEGNKNRTLAATFMNETSSRAHTLITLSFVQNFIRENRTKKSKIYMVDLAGSERASQSGATGIRFEESKNINKSLMTLGVVIKNLCSLAGGRNDQGAVPYRDSNLTMLLKDAIGGNSKTIMVTTISPADEAYEQTLSTLRYADRVKCIKNSVKMNIAATDTLVKELLAEKEALLAKLKTRPDPGLGYTEHEIKRLREKHLNEIKEIRSELTNTETTWKKRLKETKRQMEEQLEIERREQKEKSEIPHLWNLNEDSNLSNKIYYLLKEGIPVTVGNARATKTQSIELHGPSIAKEHAILQNMSSVVTLIPLQGHVKVNGVKLTQPVILQHQDRLFFSANNLFVFHSPIDNKQLEQKGVYLPPITYERAQSEIAKNSTVDTTGEYQWLRDEVAEMLVLTTEANAMSVEMDKNVTFHPVVVANIALGDDSRRSKIYIRVRTDNGGEFIWGRYQFLDRFDLMLDMFQKYENNDPAWQIQTKTQDPFWEPLDSPTLIGVAYIPLEPVAYMLDIDDQQIGIYDYQARHVGYITVGLVPCTHTGEECYDDKAVDEPIDLLGESLTFKLKIKGATGIPRRFKSSWCHYTFMDEKGRDTPEIQGSGPKYNFEYIHRVPKLSQNMIDYLEEKCIPVELYGRQCLTPCTETGKNHNSYTTLDSRRQSNFSDTCSDGNDDRDMKVEKASTSVILADTIQEDDQNEPIYVKEMRQGISHMMNKILERDQLCLDEQ